MGVERRLPFLVQLLQHWLYLAAKRGQLHGHCSSGKTTWAPARLGAWGVLGWTLASQDPSTSDLSGAFSCNLPVHCFGSLPCTELGTGVGQTH